MKAKLKIILICSLTLMVGDFVLLILDLPFNLHAPIPLVPVRPLGILTGALIITVIIVALRKLKIHQPEISLVKYALWGTLMVCISEIFFQLIRQYVWYNLQIGESLVMYFHSLIVMSAFGFIISFLTAFQLKTRKTKQLVIMIIGFLIFFNILVRIFPTIFEQ